MDNKDVKLKTPLKVNGETIDHLSIREPLAMDLIQLDDSLNQNARMLRMIETCSGHAPNDLVAMTGKDFFECTAVVNDFLG